MGQFYLGDLDQFYTGFNSMPQERIEALQRGQEYYLSSMQQVSAIGSQITARVLASLPELPEASFLDKVDRLLTD